MATTEIVRHNCLAGDYSAEVIYSPSPLRSDYHVKIYEDETLIFSPAIAFQDAVIAYHYALGWADAAEDYRI